MRNEDILKIANFFRKLRVCCASLSLKKAIRIENSSLTKEVQDLKAKQNDQVMYSVDPATVLFLNSAQTCSFQIEQVCCLFLLSPMWNLSVIVLICE